MAPGKVGDVFFAFNGIKYVVLDVNFLDQTVVLHSCTEHVHTTTWFNVAHRLALKIWYRDEKVNGN